MSDSMPPADNVALNLIQFINNASVKMMRALSCVGAEAGSDAPAATAWTAVAPPTSLPPSHQHHRRLPAHGTQRGAGRSGRASESPPLRLSAREAAAADPYGGVAARRRRRQRTPDGRALRRGASAVCGGRTASTSSSSSSGSSDYSGGVGGGVAYSSPRAADSPLLSGDDSVFDSLLVAGSIGAPASGDPSASGSYAQAAFVPFNAPSTSPPVAGADGSGRFGSSCAQPTASVGDSCDAHYRLPTAMHANSWEPRTVQPLSASPLPPQPACEQSNHFAGARWHPMSTTPTSSCDFADGSAVGGGYYYYAGDEGRWPGATNSSWYATSAGVIAGFRNFAHAPSSQPQPMAADVSCIGSSVPLTSTCDPLLPPSAASASPEPRAAPAAAAAGWRPASDAATTTALDCAPSIGDMLDGLYDLLFDCATTSSCSATHTCASAAPAALQTSLFAQCA